MALWTGMGDGLRRLRRVSATPGFAGPGGTYPDGDVERNELGLSLGRARRPARDGLGMIVNMDHVSSKARTRIHDISVTEFGGYPLNALHNNPSARLIGSGNDAVRRAVRLHEGRARLGARHRRHLRRAPRRWTRKVRGVGRPSTVIALRPRRTPRSSPSFSMKDSASASRSTSPAAPGRRSRAPTGRAGTASARTGSEGRRRGGARPRAPSA